jgi:hypothetical protein
MADLGDLMGSLMTGVIRARRVADEQTAALAEYYKTNPLLEDLSIPRIRIPELTIDIPMLIEDLLGGESVEMEEPDKIAAEAEAQLKSTMEKNNITISPAFQHIFANEVKKRLVDAKQSGAPIMNETIARNVQNAFADTLSKTKSTLTASENQIIARDLRDKVSAVSIIKQPVNPSIIANIKTADVKERSSNANVVRLKITLKEEGLEWATQATDSGGVKHTLQPE